jgi:hypothetical protein
MPTPPISFFGIGTEGSADPNGWFDFAFGDEIPPNWDPEQEALDLGFGDEPMGMDVPVLIVLFDPALSGFYSRLPDDGGVVMTLQGDFSVAKTFKVRIKNTFTGELFPLSPLPGCLAVVPAKTSGTGWEIEPLVDLKRLQFALPALPPAVYSIKVYFGANYAQELPELSSAFRVIRRHHTPEQYTLRGLPEHWYGTGPRVIQNEPKLGGV